MRRVKRAYKPEVKKDVDLANLIERFGCEERCHRELAHLRWPDGPTCPRCNHEKVLEMPERRIFECRECHYQFSVRVGTIFHDSKLPLWKWFMAVYLMSESKKGISANQLKRMLNVSYKSAWYLCHRIRAAMKDEAPELLRGIVEVDETGIGGVGRGLRRKGTKTRMDTVVGAVERGEGGRIRLKLIPNRGTKTLHRFVGEAIHDDAREIHTDDWAPYDGIGDHNTKHRIVRKKEGWVNADVHTNTVEGVWSLFKRSIVGSYHKLSTKHLPAYLDEMAFRYNNRENKYMFRDTLLKLVAADQLEYKKLTA